MKNHTVAIILGGITVLVLAACSSIDPPLTPTHSNNPGEPTPTPTPNPGPTPTPTPLPPKELTVCESALDEPNTLFLYGGPSRGARNVLEAIYDGPIDTRSFEFEPVILEKIPDLADGDAALQVVEVEEGDLIIDANDEVTPLEPSTIVVGGNGQQIVFQGQPITMTQMVITYTLLPGVTWSDGEPLTAADSTYSFDLAGEFSSPAIKMLHERTADYRAIDDRTLVWTGIPGYNDTFYFLNFYHPLPEHVWGEYTAEQLLTTEISHQRPLGWGAFVIEEWVAGEFITLSPNEHYFRADDGLPHLDRLMFRFVPNLEAALAGLQDGSCDIIGEGLIEQGDPEDLLPAAEAGMLEIVTSPSNEWEHLDFAINTMPLYQEPNFFGALEVRQAVAQCVSKELIMQETFPIGASQAAHSYVHPQHPLYAEEDLIQWEYDPAAGRALLEEIGWRDDDGDGTREAYGVPGIAWGTPFTVTLYTTVDDPVRDRTAHIVTENLESCGIGVSVEKLPDRDFFADGPNGPILGRQFDLALFSWLNDLDAPCWLYLSSNIPGADNWWSGVASNTPGYTDEEYDQVCEAAMNALPGTEEYVQLHHQAQRIFTNDLPVLPLYFVPKMVAVKPGIEGVELDPSQYLEMWNVEAFDVNFEDQQ